MSVYAQAENDPSHPGDPRRHLWPVHLLTDRMGVEYFDSLLSVREIAPLAAGLFSWKMNPMIGAAAMSLSSFTVCMNALRLNLFRLQDSTHDRKMHKAVDPEEPEETEPDPLPVRTVFIDGMMCEHCEAAIKKALEKLDFVEEATADYHEGSATIRLCGEPDEAAIRKAVEDEDYEYLNMQ